MPYDRKLANWQFVHCIMEHTRPRLFVRASSRDPISWIAELCLPTVPPSQRTMKYNCGLPVYNNIPRNVTTASKPNCEASRKRASEDNVYHTRWEVVDIAWMSSSASPTNEG